MSINKMQARLYVCHGTHGKRVGPSFRQRYVKDLTSSERNEAGYDRTGIPLVVLGHNWTAGQKIYGEKSNDHTTHS